MVNFKTYFSLMNSGFIRFRLAELWRSRNSTSIYLSVIAPELCPASSLTCSPSGSVHLTLG